MTWITHAEYQQGHTIQLTFNDGFTASVDLYETLVRDHRTILSSLSNEREFKNFRVENDTIVWENGADLSLEFLRELAEKKSLIHT